METSAINTEYLRKLVILYSVIVMICRGELRSAIICIIRGRAILRIRLISSWGRGRLSNACETIK